jgi:hypothetical protein
MPQMVWKGVTETRHAAKHLSLMRNTHNNEIGQENNSADLEFDFSINTYRNQRVHL